MNHRLNKKLPGSQASGVRRTMLALLAFTYLFVGMSHAISCADEVVVASIASDFSIPLDEGGPDDDGTKKLPVVTSHCYVCAPVLTPALAAVGGPSAKPVRLSIVAQNRLHANPLWLDTPPPKDLT
ncbi:hypothetical protein K7460_29920 [Pseudomonas fluorescens]|jgi:hypothetical protein|nr:hypothetical protein [Pseudomonas fluorescens]